MVTSNGRDEGLRTGEGTDRDLLAAPDQLANDDLLVRRFAGNAVGSMKIDSVVQVSFRVLSQLLERWPPQQRARNSIVDVFLHKHIARPCDLPLQLNNLALDCPLFLLRIRARTTPLFSYTLNRFHRLREESNRNRRWTTIWGVSQIRVSR